MVIKTLCHVDVCVIRLLLSCTAASIGANQQFASFLLPLSFGCTPSLVSVLELKPELQSTTVTREAGVDFNDAQLAIALFKAFTR
jgi:hypothetical protein